MTLIPYEPHRTVRAYIWNRANAGIGSSLIGLIDTRDIDVDFNVIEKN